jgi:hypothetical protein
MPCRLAAEAAAEAEAAVAAADDEDEDEDEEEEGEDEDEETPTTLSEEEAEEADALLGGDLPPDPQRIADKARRGGAHPGGIARESGMPLAVDLHVVGPHGLEQPLDALAGGAFAHLLAVGAGVKVEVHAQEALASLQPRGVLRRREAHALGRRVFSRCGQGWHKDHRDQQMHSRASIAHVGAPDPPVRALVSMAVTDVVYPLQIRPLETTGLTTPGVSLSVCP